MKLLLTFVLAAYVISGVAMADDSNSDAPVGFSAVVDTAKGVMLRVPVNAAGEENTDAAEMRFFDGDRSTINTQSVSSVWETSKSVVKDDVLLGKNGPTVNPNNDSSTWGWYNWNSIGWGYPYYYSYYTPTFYYYNYWYTYPYYQYWNYNYYRYYYYWY